MLSVCKHFSICNGHIWAGLAHHPPFTEMPFVEIDFGDLEFHETLGRGSAGSVYRGVWKSKEKVVALKKLNLLESEVYF